MTGVYLQDCAGSVNAVIPNVYVASKSKYGPLWCEFREAWQGLAVIVSSWIDESGEGESDGLADLWTRCIGEARSADLLIACYEDGDIWKGAYIEIGAALAYQKPVYLCGRPPGSFINHPLVTLASDPDDALADFLAFRKVAS